VLPKLEDEVTDDAVDSPSVKRLIELMQETIASKSMQVPIAA
jgi:hypothetical protein